jgi:hypothetical protein
VPGTDPLPAAVQLVAGRGRDAQALELGRRLEAALSGGD